MPRCTWKQCCSMLLVIVDVVLLVGCPVTMIAIGVGLGKPHYASRHFSETTCEVQKWIKAGQISCYCDKGSGCKSKYPCVEIIVAYVTEDGKNVSNATLFDDAHNFLNYGYLPVNFDSGAIRCSTYSCEGNELTDAHNVAEFVDAYGNIKQKYTCYYNRENNSQVLLSKVSTGLLTLGLLLPLIFFIAAFILFIFIYHRILKRRGEKLLCLGRLYDAEPNELSPPIPVIAVSESTF